MHQKTLTSTVPFFSSVAKTPASRLRGIRRSTHGCGSPLMNITGLKTLAVRKKWAQPIKKTLESTPENLNSTPKVPNGLNSPSLRLKPTTKDMISLFGHLPEGVENALCGTRLSEGYLLTICMPGSPTTKGLAKVSPKDPYAHEASLKTKAGSHRIRHPIEVLGQSSQATNPLEEAPHSTISRGIPTRKFWARGDLKDSPDHTRSPVNNDYVVAYDPKPPSSPKARPTDTSNPPILSIASNVKTPICESHTFPTLSLSPNINIESSVQAKNSTSTKPDSPKGNTIVYLNNELSRDLQDSPHHPK